MKKNFRRILALALCGVLAVCMEVPAFATFRANRTMAQSISYLNDSLLTSYSKKGENVFYSPYSIESALYMAELGADNNTKVQMNAVMGIDDPDAFLKEYDAFRNKERPDSAKLINANSVWVNTKKISSKDLSKTYINTLKNKMGAEVKQEAFSALTKKHVSDWVKKNTDGFISDYDPTLDADTYVDLINAVYFYGEWQSPFKKEDTKQMSFKNLDGSKTKVSMMTQEDYFLYNENSKVKAVELPYGDGSVVMDVILTKKSSNRDVAKQWLSMTSQEREKFLKDLDSSEGRDVNLQLPKFKEDLKLDALKDTLKALGMTDAFDPKKADFSKMSSSQNLSISDVSHRAKIEVDENGSKAAAVTEIGIVGMSLYIPENIVDFHCDQPFLYLIRDKESGVILFTGVQNTMAK